MSIYNELIKNLEILGFNEMAKALPSVIELVNTNHLTFIDALHNLTKQELEFRDERAKKINITVSSFPYVKTVDDFDFNYQPTVNKSLIYDLKSLRFMSEHKNIIFIGSPGTGKTHLAVSIGVEAASQRISTYFINFAVLMGKIKKSNCRATN